MIWKREKKVRLRDKRFAHALLDHRDGFFVADLFLYHGVWSGYAYPRLRWMEDHVMIRKVVTETGRAWYVPTERGTAWAEMVLS